MQEKRKSELLTVEVRGLLNGIENKLLSTYYK